MLARCPGEKEEPATPTERTVHRAADIIQRDERSEGANLIGRIWATQTLTTVDHAHALAVLREAALSGVRLPRAI